MDRLLSEQAVIDEIHTYWLAYIEYKGCTDKAIKVGTRHNKKICEAIKELPSADLDRELSCDGCIYPYGMGINCDLCCRNYPDRYEEERGTDG